MIRKLPADCMIVLLSGVISACHLGKVSSVIDVLQNEFHITLVTASFLLSIMYLSGMLLGLLVGVLCGRLGDKKSILIGQILLCTGGILGACSQDIYVLMCSRILESFALLMVILPSPGLLRRLVPQERLSEVIGMWGGYVATGTAISFFLGMIVAHFYGWRVWWICPSIGSAIMVFSLSKLLPDRKPDHGRMHLSHLGGEGKLSIKQQFRDVFSHGESWLIGIAFAFYAGQWLAIIGFLPTLIAGLTSSTFTAAVLSGLAPLVNICGTVVATAKLRKGYPVVLLLTVGYLGMSLMTVLAFAVSGGHLTYFKFLALLGFSAMGGLIPPALYMLGLNSTPRGNLLTAVIGKIQQLSSMGMLILPPALAKLVLLSGGWFVTWMFSGGASLIGVFLVSNIRSAKR